MNEKVASNHLADIIANHLPDEKSAADFWRDFDAAGLSVGFGEPDTSVLQNDLREMLQALGMNDGAQAKSPHQVFQEALAEMKRRLLDHAPSTLNPLSRAAEVARELRRFHRNSCYPEAMDSEINQAIQRLNELVAPPVRSAASTDEPAPVPYEKHEAEMLKIIDERETAQSCIDDIYFSVMGRTPQWSNMFGFTEAVDEITETVASFISGKVPDAAPTTSPEPATCKDSLQVQSSPEPDAVREPEIRLEGNWIVDHSRRLSIAKFELYNGTREELQAIIDRANAALSAPAAGAKRLSEYSLGELQSEMHRRAQEFLGDPRVGVTIPRHQRGSEA